VARSATSKLDSAERPTNEILQPGRAVFDKSV
jgi:hypothetical protein